MQGDTIAVSAVLACMSQLIDGVIAADLVYRQCSHTSSYNQGSADNTAPLVTRLGICVWFCCCSHMSLATSRDSRKAAWLC